jgi:hypothetical protein
MKEVFIDSFFDSLNVLWFVLIFNILLSFVEEKLSKLLSNSKNVSPVLGSGLGLFPQCGISVVSSDLYIKNKITLGTLIAIFVSSSDEAIPILLSNSNHLLDVLYLLTIKFVIGLFVGLLIDFVIVKNKEVVINDDIDVHIGCCGHEIDHHESILEKHIIHPIVHAFKIFIYVLIINFIFGLAIYFIGSLRIITFLEKNKYITPLIAAFVGLIPNCASSVLLVNMFTLNQLSFGALTSGLIANSGLGLVVLLKNKKLIKKTLIIICILLITAIISGYLISLVSGF